MVVREILHHRSCGWSWCVGFVYLSENDLPLSSSMWNKADCSCLFFIISKGVKDDFDRNLEARLS